MTRFQCAGPACEATCCQTWHITVDEAHYHKLKSAMDRSAGDRETFRASHRRVKDETKDPTRYALIVLGDDGRCTLLDGEGTCSVHRRFGAAYLSDTCANYPRKISIARTVGELAGSLSCPEVARQLLLHDDALAIDPFDIRTVRDRPGQHVPAESEDLYDVLLDDVRTTIAALLEQPGYPLSSRLFFVGWFAEQTRAAFRRGATPDAAEVVERAARRVGDPRVLDAWHQTIAGHAVTAPRAGWVVVSALKERVERQLSYQPFRDVVRAAFASIGATGDGDDVQLDPTAVFAAYGERRDRRDGPEIDAMLTRYAVDYWFKDYYTGSPDLAVHAHKLVLRLALLRFLLFTHPRYDELGPGAALVEVLFKMARAIEHDATFRTKLDELLVSLELTSLAHAVFLMKF